MRVFWKRPERETLGEWPEAPGPFAVSSEAPAPRPLIETVKLERGASRAATISRVAEELRWRGEEVLEIFEEISSPVGQAVLPIHLRRDGGDVFFEVETGSWAKRIVGDVLKTAAVLRNSEYSDAALEVLSAYPVPEEVRYLCKRTPAALFQLDLVHYGDSRRAEVCARAFGSATERHWNLNLDHDPEELSRIEELLLTALKSGDGAPGRAPERAPVLDALVRGFGCYAGEVLRRHAAPQGSWRSTAGWGEEDFVVEFPDATADPVGKARAFLENGPEDSVAFYVSYVLEELNEAGWG